MSNWLGFSLSPQDQQNPPQSLSCFDLPFDSAIPILDSNPHSQDWKMNDLNTNIVSRSSSQNLEDKNRPKLENFLGVNHQEHKNQLTMHEDSASNNGNNGNKMGNAAVESVPRRSIDTFGQRTSIYRGVTRHRWTGRYEAHLWDNSCRREGQSRKGRQVYLGGYDNEDKAARAYDLSALKYWGTTTTTNFPISNYEKEIEGMKNMTRQEFVASIRRKSSGFSRGASIYRGVTRHHQQGRWQARIGRVAGNKDLYLGTFSTEEEAAEAYDVAAIKFRGLSAVTNFEVNRYDVKSILESSTLPIRGAAKRLKDAENAEMAMDLYRASEKNLNMHLTEGQMSGFGSANTHQWPTVAFQQSQPLSMYPYAHQMLWCKQEHDPYVGHAYNEINHQLHLGNTHNFMQPSLLHNITGLDSSNIEQSPGSNSNSYGDGSMVPAVGALIVQDGNQRHGNGYFLGNDEGKFLDYETMFRSADAHNQARNLHHQSQDPSSNLAKATNNLYDQGSTSTTRIPSVVPTGLAAARAKNGAGNQVASTFSVERHMKLGLTAA
ncbi:AP2-like ethylene-responsive transcription factor BBM [Salvia splendens]|uniref:AP2-like ethylene-responsive transcription factor BBM n=1 Tax=Salvia splendens TaxID=180675 RepID=UPI001C255B67|nr:AP2-like ethylene-responsive transcription factor BBM [Salvia splendens]